MALHLRKTVAIAALLAVAATTALADVLTYTNSRYGTSVSFPAELFNERMDPPDNGDGITFLAVDGGSLAVYASNNALDMTPQSLADEMADDAKIEITYRKVGKDWVVLSGFQDGLIFYQRSEFGRDNVIHSVLLKYPQSRRTTYDPVAGSIADTLNGP